MATLMTWILAHVLPPGASCQTVSVPPWTARASALPPGPGASVAVPGGSAGSGCHEDPVLVMIWPRCALVMIAAVASGPNDAEAGESSGVLVPSMACARMVSATGLAWAAAPGAPGPP
jgi:hypothetical protein